MKSSLFRATAIASLTLAVTAAHAGASTSEAALMDACIQQYIADNLANYSGKVTVNKLMPVSGPIRLNSAMEIKVSAVHKTTGTHLGTVVCSVEKDGKIVVAPPTAAAAAKLTKLNKSPVMARSSGE